MKKYLMLTLLLALAATAAFALDITTGLMVNTMNRTRDTYFDYGDGEYMENGVGIGLYGSVGWKYVDFNLAVFWYTADISVDWSTVSLDSFSSPVSQLGAYFKVPFTITPKLRIFPTIGIDFVWGVIISEAVDMGLYMGGGMGADLMLFGNIFLRANILAGYDFFKHGFGMVFKAGVGWLL